MDASASRFYTLLLATPIGGYFITRANRDPHTDARRRGMRSCRFTAAAGYALGRGAFGPCRQATDCDMPVLRHEPLKDFRRVAIVEALGNRYASEADVLPAVQRKACETGADAIIVLTSKAQTSESATGYYINSVAIVYGKENPSAAGTAYKIKILRETENARRMLSRRSEFQRMMGI